MATMFVDPGEPGDLGPQLRAKDLINKPLFIRPLHEAEVEGKDGKPWRYIECEVAVIGMDSIEDYASNVRISWTRVLPQLRDRIGKWVAAVPRVGDDNAVVLQPFTEDGKRRAEAYFRKLVEVSTELNQKEEYSDEPF
jgi:hypothetical protein